MPAKSIRKRSFANADQSEPFGVRPQNYGYLFGLNIIGMIVVNTINSRIVLRFGTDTILRIGCLLAALFSVALLALAKTGAGGLGGIVATLFLFLAMTGFIGANAAVGAMSVFPTAAGAASALIGMLQWSFGAASGWAVGILADGTAVPMAAVICATALASAALNLALLNNRRVEDRARGQAGLRGRT